MSESTHDQASESSSSSSAPTVQKKPRNPHRITLAECAENEGYESVEELVEAFGFDSVMPALCDEGCQVEPDGTCEHGCPSLMIAAGLI